MLLISIFLTKELDILFFYFTQLTYVVNLIYLLSAMLYTIRPPQSREDMVWRVHRVLHIIAMAGEATVVIFYWAFVAEDTIPEYEDDCSSVTWCYINTVVTHGVSLLPSWIVVLTMYTEMYWTDFIWPTIYGLSYMFLVLLPVTLFVQNLYADITFNNVSSYLYILGACALLIACFFIGYYVSLRKKKGIEGALLLDQEEEQ